MVKLKAWHKDLQRFVPYNPQLRSNPAIEIIEEPVEAAESVEVVAEVQVKAAEPAPKRGGKKVK
jgi:hypothetical protein